MKNAIVDLSLDLTGMSRDFSDDERSAIYDQTLNGIMVRPVDEAPMPWDAELSLTKVGVMLRGSVECGEGSVTVVLPANRFHAYYRVDVQAMDARSAKDIKAICKACGIVATEC